MNQLYSFSTTYFGLSSQGIHLLRNGYNYKTIGFEDITSMEIRNGWEMKNWLWVLLVGVLLAGYGIFDIFQIIGLLNNPTVHDIKIQRLLIPVFPLLLGVYSIVVALRTTRIMEVKCKDKTHYFSLRELIKSNQLSLFVDEMRKVRTIRVLGNS
jgi:hypothetical protein